jgi:hypothetical protein
VFNLVAFFVKNNANEKLARALPNTAINKGVMPYFKFMSRRIDL